MNLKKRASAALLIAGLLPGLALAMAPEGKIFTPYFNMNLSQGGYLPNTGNFFTGANVGMNVGMLSKINETNSIFTLYSLGFAGQAFRFPDTQEFASKSLSHNFTGEYRWKILDWLRIRPGVAYTINYTRTAAGEIWGQGLYDSKSIGGQLAVDTTFNLFDKDSGLTFQWIYRNVVFPNYTDIIREFQGESSNTDLAGGLKDQIFNEFGMTFYWSKFFTRLRYDLIDYKNEHVVENTGVYGPTAQFDSNIILSGGLDAKLWIFETSPEVSYTMHRSNQNFLLFQSVTDPNPVFAGNYYDYSEVGLAVPLFLNLTQKWALSGGFDYQHRSYTDRQPRDGNNQFVGGTQSNNMVTLSVGIRKKLNDISSMTLNFSSVVATSNNNFERYLPYNYSGQSVSLGYQLTY